MLQSDIILVISFSIILCLGFIYYSRMIFKSNNQKINTSNPYKNWYYNYTENKTRKSE